MYRVRTFLIFCLVASATACGKGSSDRQPAGAGEPTPMKPAVSVAAAPPPPPAPPKPPEKVDLEIGAVASTMTFDKTSLTVPAGAEVHLVLKDAKPGTLLHNWVLVQPGSEAKVAAAGLPAGAAGNYVTPGPDVLAFTPLAKPGGTSEVTFQAPAAGSYPYICSFPGHYLLMKGTLVVTPAAGAGAPATAASAPVAAGATEAVAAARQLFDTRCVVCHGAAGRGDGPGAAALTVKPRAFGDATWQAAVSDELISKTIVLGGPAMGKDPGMPPNPDLAAKPDVVKQLVVIIRAFKK